MLDEYKEEQKIIYQILKKEIKTKKISHAYLFETNGYEKKEQFIRAFAKTLLCPFNLTEKNDKCVNCYQCHNIDNNLFSELEIIYPDGLWIKKEQLMLLQEQFKTKSLQTNKKVYIIFNAECLNDSAANSILKFLEEPQDNIIAILVTDNIHQLLDTIISRCQVLTLAPTIKQLGSSKKIETYLLNQYSEEELIELIKNTLDFIYFNEKNNFLTICYTKQIFIDIFKERNTVVDFLQIMLLFYKDLINISLQKKPEFFEEKDLKINTMSLDTLNNKISIILQAQKNVKNNVNLNLLIDKLIIDLGGGL